MHERTTLTLWFVPVAGDSKQLSWSPKPSAPTNC